MNGRNRRTKVSIIIPAHNEEGNIEPLMTEFDNALRSCNFQPEIIFVNDGSTDKTENKMLEAMRRYHYVRLVKNRVRMGLTTALNKGFAAARGEILVFYPADLQFHPRDIPRMVDAIENGADMVCGKKIGAYGKKMVSWIYNVLTRMLFPKLKVTDMNSVKAFTREVYESLPPMREGWHRYMAAFAASNDFIVREIPVNLSKRHSGKSKFRGSSRIIKGFTDLIAVKFQVSVFGDPMHLFGKWSMLFFFAGLLVAGVAFYQRFALQHGYRPMLYAVIMLELSSLILFVMGIITEALVYLRDSLHDMRDQNKHLAQQVEQLSGRAPHRGLREKVEPELPFPREKNQAERGERPERSDRPERGDRPERADRTDRGDRPERGPRPDRGDRPDRGEHGGPRQGRRPRRPNQRRDRRDQTERPESQTQLLPQATESPAPEAVPAISIRELPPPSPASTENSHDGAE
jgi:glycosyltransferase involved in cell wall biosynthesis